MEVPEVDSRSVKILLGANVVDAVLQQEIRKGLPGQPVAVLTRFGWTLTGSVKQFVPPEQSHKMHVNLIQSSDDLLHRQVQNWWRTDLFGTKFEHQSPRSREDARALEMLEKTVKHCGDRYEVGLLWKDENVELPKNRVMAEKRLESTERMLKRNNEVSEKYCQIIEDYVSKGYARKLTKAEIESSESKEWFLPHHPVLNPNKPGKVRIVMDAAAKHQGISLNDNLLIGPDLLNSLVGVLLRFREFPVAIAADIEAMFLQ